MNYNNYNKKDNRCKNNNIIVNRVKTKEAGITTIVIIIRTTVFWSKSYIQAFFIYPDRKMFLVLDLRKKAKFLSSPGTRAIYLSAHFREGSSLVLCLFIRQTRPSCRRLFPSGLRSSVCLGFVLLTLLTWMQNSQGCQIRRWQWFSRPSFPANYIATKMIASFSSESFIEIYKILYRDIHTYKHCYSLYNACMWPTLSH